MLLPLAVMLLALPGQDAPRPPRPLKPTYESAFAKPRLLPPAPREQPPLGSDEEVKERYDRAWDLVHADDYDAALEEFVWLWNATDNKQSAFEPAIRSRIIESIGRVSPHHEPTRQRFTQILDGVEAYIREGHHQSYREWTDWADLSRSMGQAERLIKLYEERRAPDGSLESFAALSEEEVRAKAAAGELPFPKDVFHPYAYDDLFEVLLERGRYADAGRLHADIVGQAEFELGITEKMLAENPELRGHISVDDEHQEARKEVALLYALALAADRRAEAAKVSAALLARFDDAASRTELIDACRRVGVSGPELARWQAEVDGSRAESR